MAGIIIITTGNITDSYFLFVFGLEVQLIPGDINGDGKVRIDDVLLAVQAFGSEQGDPHWNPLADMNGDGKIRIDDILAIAQNFGLGE